MTRRRAIRHVYDRHRELSGCSGPLIDLKVRPAATRRLWVVTARCPACGCELHYEVVGT